MQLKHWTFLVEICYRFDLRKGTSLLISNKAIIEYIYDSYNKMLIKFDRISISIDVSFVRMISHFPLFLPTLRDLVANVMHRLWNCMVEFRPTGMSFIYYTYRNGPKTYPWNTPDSIGTLILSTVNYHITPNLVPFFYLSYVLEIVHYYDVCPFTILENNTSCVHIQKRPLVHF
jgi:hypothetical protein